MRVQKFRARESGLGLGLDGQIGIKGRTVLELLAHRFYQQVCSHLHMFILIGDDQAHKQLPSTLFLRLLQLTIASIDRYEPWDQDSLISVAQRHLKGAQGLPLGDGEHFLLALVIHLNQSNGNYYLCLSLSLKLSEPPSPFLSSFLSQERVHFLSLSSNSLVQTKATPVADSLKCPDLQDSIPSVAKAMALIHLSAASYHGHLCPELPLVTPKTFLDFLDTFLLLQQQMILKVKNKAQR